MKKLIFVFLSVCVLSACGTNAKLKDPSVFHLNKRNIIEKNLTSESVSSPLIEQGIETRIEPASIR